MYTMRWWYIYMYTMRWYLQRNDRVVGVLYLLVHL